jgi:hypothetical protein
LKKKYTATDWQCCVSSNDTAPAAAAACSDLQYLVCIYSGCTVDWLIGPLETIAYGESGNDWKLHDVRENMVIDVE